MSEPQGNKSTDLVSPTPGPWRTVGTMNPYSNEPLQNVFGPTPPGAQSGHLVASYCRPPDARLIAAAPDLLEALKLLVEETKLSGNWNAKDYGWPKAIAATIAALAKAEGSHV